MEEVTEGQPSRTREHTRTPIADVGGAGTLQALNIACNLLERVLVDCVSSGFAKFYLSDCEDEGELSVSALRILCGWPVVRRKRKSKSTALPTHESNESVKSR